MNHPFLAIGLLAETITATFLSVLNITDLEQRIVLLATALAAVGFIFVRIVKPLWQFGRKAAQAVDVLLELPEVQAQTEQRLAHIETELGINATV